jgi:hypothetical protein
MFPRESRFMVGFPERRWIQRDRSMAALAGLTRFYESVVPFTRFIAKGRVRVALDAADATAVSSAAALTAIIQCSGLAILHTGESPVARAFFLP